MMATPKSRLLLVSGWVLLGYLAPSACAVSDDEPIEDGECLFGPTCGLADGGTEPGTATLVDAASSELSDASIQGELCGVGACSPDDVRSCADLADASLGDASSDAASASPSEDAAGEGAPGAPPPVDAGPSLDADVADAAAPGAGSADAGGSVTEADAGATSGEPPDTFACQVVGSAERPERRCLPAGSKELSAPCDDAAECAPGLTCIAEAGQGSCRPYCCSGNDSCGAGTYCTPKPALRDGLARPVPACVTADNCSLDEGFPCAGDSCVCRTGTACTVVRGDGTTSCVPPGRGLDGDECPCAAGYFCSPASGTCLQICELAATSTADCVAGHCQMAAGFPDGWGVCVGATSER